MPDSKDNLPTDAQVAKYKYLSPMLDSALGEMREFAKKKQDGIVNESKIKILNRLLKDLKGILENEDSAPYLDLLDERQLPENSDAVLVLGQYRAALDSFEKRHYTYEYGGKQWVTRELVEASEESRDEDDEEEEESGEGSETT